MDLKGSLTNTNLKIYPSETLLNFLETLSTNDEIPENILKIVKHLDNKVKIEKEINTVDIHLNDNDIKKINKIKEVVNDKKLDKPTKNETESTDINSEIKVDASKTNSDFVEIPNAKDDNESSDNGSKQEEKPEVIKGPYIFTSDIDWLYTYLQKKRTQGEKDIPYLHVLLEGAHVEMPENEVIKRNPVLEARCVKLRAQQEAREYRKMTKGVDNVRIRFPEDSISYQLKQLNRQLIAIGQFILSIFAGFLFGFKGVDWIVGNLDFGFRLLLGVMCALVIALAEIYFLAKKLNEELNVPETIQLGGPPKFVDEKKYGNVTGQAVATNKEHQD